MLKLTIVLSDLEEIMPVLKIYTDGGCSGNQSDENIGGWGSILVFGDVEKEIYGGELNTTNNRMEMKALLESFKALNRDNLTIQVFSDSSYLMDCFRKKWYANWVANGWRTANKKPVENRDLWEGLLPYLDRHNISFYRVKGHVNLNSKVTDFQKLYKKFVEWNGTQFTYEDFEYVTDMNNRADVLANKGIDELR